MSVSIARRLAWALVGILVGLGFLGPIIGPVVGLVGLVLASALAMLDRDSTAHFVPWLTIGALVTVGSFVGADLLAPQRCTPTGCTEPVALPARLAVAALAVGLLSVVAGRLESRRASASPERPPSSS